MKLHNLQSNICFKKMFYEGLLSSMSGRICRTSASPAQDRRMAGAAQHILQRHVNQIEHQAMSTWKEQPIFYVQVLEYFAMQYLIYSFKGRQVVCLI